MVFKTYIDFAKLKKINRKVLQNKKMELNHLVSLQIAVLVPLELPRVMKLG